MYKFCNNFKSLETNVNLLISVVLFEHLYINGVGNHYKMKVKGTIQYKYKHQWRNNNGYRISGYWGFMCSSELNLVDVQPMLVIEYFRC